METYPAKICDEDAIEIFNVNFCNTPTTNPTRSTPNLTRPSTTSKMSNIQTGGGNDDLDDVASSNSSVNEYCGPIIPIHQEIDVAKEIEDDFTAKHRTIRLQLREVNKQFGLIDTYIENQNDISFIDAKYHECRVAIYSLGKTASSIFGYSEQAIPDVAMGNAGRMKDEIELRKGEIEKLVESFEKLEVSYAKLKSVELNKIKQEDLLRMVSQQGGQQQQQGGGFVNQQLSTFRLAPLSLQSFNPSEQAADFGEWKNFFESATDGMTSSQRSFYLRQYVAGDALNVIAQIPRTDEGYDEAMNMLEKTFGNIQYLENRMMVEFIDYTRSGPTKSRNMKSTREEWRVLLRHINRLLGNRQGDFKSQYFCLLNCLILQKTPAFLSQRAFEKKREFESDTQAVMDPKDLLEILDGLISNVEMYNSEKEKLDRTPQVDKGKAAPFKPRSDRQVGNATVEDEYGKVQRDKTGKVLTCRICGDSHYTRKCHNPGNLSLEMIKKALKDQNRCLKCLGVGHFANRCDQSPYCKTCKGAHHYLVCPTRQEVGPETALPPKGAVHFSSPLASYKEPPPLPTPYSQ